MAPAVSPPGTSGRRRAGAGLVVSASMLFGAAIGLWCGAPREARADDEGVAGQAVPPVLDETGLLASSTKKKLIPLLQRLERDTGLKVRIICPRQGLQQRRPEWKEYLRPISQRMGIDQNSLVIVAEQRAQEKSGKMLGLLNLSPGFKLTERFQYRFTSDFLVRVSNKYGDPRYVDLNGTDTAIKETTEQLVAALYDLVANPRKRESNPLSAEEVAAILEQHKD